MVDGNPAALTVTGDTLEHEIRATAPGYEDYKKAVRFERDISLEIMLQPVTAAAATSAADDVVIVHPKVNASPPSNNARSPSASSKKSKTNCDPPFYYEDGIKTFKPGCL